MQLQSNELRDLSPLSRRRLQKRMYMRKKRAQARGEDVVHTPYLLKPGRRKKGAGVTIAKPKPNNLKDTDSTGPELFCKSRLKSLIRSQLRLQNIGSATRQRGWIDEELESIIAGVTRSFVVDVVGRVIVFREERKKMKGRIGVWKGEGENLIVNRLVMWSRESSGREA